MKLFVVTRASVSIYYQLITIVGVALRKAMRVGVQELQLSPFRLDPTVVPLVLKKALVNISSRSSWVVFYASRGMTESLSDEAKVRIEKLGRFTKEKLYEWASSKYLVCGLIENKCSILIMVDVSTEMRVATLYSLNKDLLNEFKTVSDMVHIQQQKLFALSPLKPSASVSDLAKLVHEYVSGPKEIKEVNNKNNTVESE